MAILSVNALGAAPGTRPPVWESLAPMPVGNAGFAHATLAGKVVIAGGTTWENGTKVVSDSAWCYAPDADRWTELARLPRRFAFGGFTCFDPELVLLGGDDGSRTWSDGYTFRPVAAATTGFEHFTLPEACGYVGSASDGNAVYLLGGTPDLRDLSRLRADFFARDRTGKIERLPDFPGGRVMHAALVALNGAIYVFPGGTYDAHRRTAANTQRAWRYLVRQKKWEEIAAYPFPVRGLGACALNERFMLLGGGFKTPAPSAAGVLTAECHIFDTERNRYVDAPPLPYAAMLVGFERTGDFAYSFGGEDGDRHRSAAVHRASVRALIGRAAP